MSLDTKVLLVDAFPSHLHEELLTLTFEINVPIGRRGGCTWGNGRRERGRGSNEQGMSSTRMLCINRLLV